MCYNILLETKGSFIGKYMGKNKEGVIKKSKDFYQTLLKRKQLVFNNILFYNNLFKNSYKIIQSRNEAKVI